MALMDKIATLDAKIKEMKVSVGLEENVSLDELVAKVESGGAAPQYKYGNIYNATGGPEMSMGHYNVLPDYTGEIPEIKATSYTNVASSYYKLDLSKLESIELGESNSTRLYTAGCVLTDSILASETTSLVQDGKHKGYYGNVFYYKKVDGKRTGVRRKKLSMQDTSSYVVKTLGVGTTFDEGINTLLDYKSIVNSLGISYGSATIDANSIKNLKIVDNVDGDSALLIWEVSISSSYGWIFARFDKNTKTVTHIRYSKLGSSSTYMYTVAPKWDGSFIFVYGDPSTNYKTHIVNISGTDISEISRQTHTGTSSTVLNYRFSSGTMQAKVLGSYLVITSTGSSYKRDYYSLIDLTNKVQKAQVTTTTELGLKFINNYNNPTSQYIVNAVDGNIYRIAIDSTTGDFKLDSSTLVDTIDISKISFNDYYNFAFNNGFIDLNKRAFVFGGNDYTLVSEIATKESYMKNLMTDVRNENNTKIFYLPFDIGLDYESYVDFDEIDFDSTTGMYLVLMDKDSMAPQYAYVGTVLEIRAPNPEDEWDSGEYTYEFLHDDYVIYNHRKYTMKQLMYKGETPSDLLKIESR